MDVEKTPGYNVRFLRGAFLWLLKGQKKKGWTKRWIANKLDIHDKDLIKAWARKYRAQGAYGLVDRRGRGSKKHGEYTDQERYIRSLEIENEVLKKYLEILGREKR
ncbi:helix-turn-helix domain-containing protein [Salimicrobium salexigens]|uniref:helix-turn-helix domain-containing protein n=1 Tax=Salimicrobium salexigens TaxID=908941 RepID=UPI0009711C9A|nr:helix-turn-helix domain-containing protein [Salimicrobium salexigens]